MTSLIDHNCAVPPAPQPSGLTTTTSPAVVDKFRGDFGALAAMMQQSWAENPNQPLLYSETYLRSAFDYPGSSFDAAPTLYKDGQMVGFIAGLPRTARWDGDRVRLVLNSFLTASAAVKGAGRGLQLWAELVHRARHTGYDGTVNFCVEGDDANRLMPGLARYLKLNTKRIYSVEFVTRLLRPAPPEPPPQITGEDIDLFMKLASALADRVPFARLWTTEEAEWQCRSRAGAVTVSAFVGPRRGMLTGYLIQVASTPPRTVVLLEDLLWGDLELSERGDLLDRFLRVSASQGACIASCPVLGYSSLEVLAAARFRPSNRVLHAYLTLWNGLQPAPVSALYMDVL